MTKFEQELCNKMQKDKHCNSIDCEVCQHMINLLTTMLKLMADKTTSEA